jgi:uncharacterized protein (DUF736 family)
MNTQYDNTNKGSYFPNDNKKTDKHPDFSGKINVGGVEYYLSGWAKVAKSGKKFHSLSVKPVVEAQAQQSAPAPIQQQSMVDDIPF